MPCRPTVSCLAVSIWSHLAAHMMHWQYFMLFTSRHHEQSVSKPSFAAMLISIYIIYLGMPPQDMTPQDHRSQQHCKVNESLKVIIAFPSHRTLSFCIVRHGMGVCWRRTCAAAAKWARHSAAAGGNVAHMRSFMATRSAAMRSANGFKSVRMCGEELVSR